MTQTTVLLQVDRISTQAHPAWTSIYSQHHDVLTLAIPASPAGVQTRTQGQRSFEDETHHTQLSGGTITQPNTLSSIHFQCFTVFTSQKSQPSYSKQHRQTPKVDRLLGPSGDTELQCDSRKPPFTPPLWWTQHPAIEEGRGYYLCFTTTTLFSGVQPLWG